MRRLRAILITALLLVPVAAYGQDASAPISLQAWASVLGLVISALTLVALLLNLGRWSQRGESGLAALAARMDACRRECDARFSELTNHGSDYAHKGFRELRSEFARKDSVEQEYRQLRELMAQQHAAVCQRLDKIERRLESDGGAE